MIPYTTFWALLESYNPQIAKDILKELHRTLIESVISTDALEKTRSLNKTKEDIIGKAFVERTPSK